MTETADWQPTFEAARRIPGSTKQRPSQKDWEELKKSTEFQRRRYVSDVAVSLGGVDTGDDFDPWGWLSGFGQVVTEHTEAIANLDSIAAALNVTASYVADDDHMATFPRIMVRTTALTGNSAAPKYRDILDYDSVSSSGTSEYRLHRGVCPTIKPQATAFPGSSTGHIYYTPIIADRVGELGEMRWIVGADTSIFSINYYEMALCAYNPSNGNVEKVWGSGDIKDDEANTTTIDEVVIDMGLSQSVTPGQVLFVAHQQTANGVLQSTRRLAAIDECDMHRTSSLLDAWCFVAPSHTQGIPSSISFASLTRELRFMPWASVSVVGA